MTRGTGGRKLIQRDPPPVLATLQVGLTWERRERPFRSNVKGVQVVVLDESRVHRYDGFELSTTQLDPLQDVKGWITGLRSVGFVSDLLAERHNLPSAIATTHAAKAISNYADVAVQYLDQAFASTAEVAFLPIFYALSNLAKITVVASGHLRALKRQRLHGATWTGGSTRSQTLLTDHITLTSEGTLPLVYQSLTGEMWPHVRAKNAKGKWIHTYRRRIRLDSVYPYIILIGHELQQIHNYESRLQDIRLSFETTYQGGRLVLYGVKPSMRRDVRIMNGMRLEGDTLVSREEADEENEEARTKLVRQVRRYLLWDIVSKIVLREAEGVTWVPDLLRTVTPLSRSTLLFPEEFPILLAFFHLSNVARYDPTRLKRLFDSSAVAMLNALIRQGTYRYMLLFWRHIQQETIFLE